jgi:hypothetical protein
MNNKPYRVSVQSDYNIGLLAIWEQQGGSVVLPNIKNPYEISNGKHVMLLYDKNRDRTIEAAHWINQGLEEEQMYLRVGICF